MKYARTFLMLFLLAAPVAASPIQDFLRGEQDSFVSFAGHGRYWIESIGWYDSMTDMVGANYIHRTVDSVELPPGVVSYTRVELYPLAVGVSEFGPADGDLYTTYNSNGTVNLGVYGVANGRRFLASIALLPGRAEAIKQVDRYSKAQPVDDSGFAGYKERGEVKVSYREIYPDAWQLVIEFWTKERLNF